MNDNDIEVIRQTIIDGFQRCGFQAGVQRVKARMISGAKAYYRASVIPTPPEFTGPVDMWLLEGPRLALSCIHFRDKPQMILDFQVNLADPGFHNLLVRNLENMRLSIMAEALRSNFECYIRSMSSEIGSELNALGGYRLKGKKAGPSELLDMAKSTTKDKLALLEKIAAPFISLHQRVEIVRELQESGRAALVDKLSREYHAVVNPKRR